MARFNAGDFLRQFAIYMDDAILAIMPPGLSAEELTGFLGAPPEPLPAEARGSMLVRDVRIQPDGLVTAYFVMRNPEGTFTTFVTLREEERGYVIIFDVDVDVDVEGDLATPAASFDHCVRLAKQPSVRRCRKSLRREGIDTRSPTSASGRA